MRRDSRSTKQAHSTGPRRGSGKTLRGQNTGQVLLPQWPELKALDLPGSGPPGGEEPRGAASGRPPRVPDPPGEPQAEGASPKKNTTKQ